MSNKNFPEDLLYNEDYSWAKVDGDTAALGIVGPAASRVKEFVFVQLPEVGEKLKKGDTYVSLEAVKWSGHLSSPFSGEVVEVNEEIFDEPGKINQDPYGEGWIVKIKLDNKKETEDLLKPEEAEKWFEDQ
ncbi:MAG: glycine cleavage system H protein [Candidatus Moranbacteria bacterium]|nr:glycine cleavage system H protein [Candidatus Moranbacteria bacterium]